MAPDRVRTLLENGYLWNSSGMAEYFFDLYSRPDFQAQYERERIRFIRSSRRFFAALAKIDGLHVYPTHANFALAELRGSLSADELVCRLLIRRGIYTRTCDDKKGLEAGGSSGSPPQPPRKRLHRSLAATNDRLKLRGRARAWLDVGAV